MSKPSFTAPFTAPFNWCDRMCERCALTSSCPSYQLGLRERGDEQASILDILDDMACEDLPVPLERRATRRPELVSLNRARLVRSAERLGEAATCVYDRPLPCRLWEAGEELVRTTAILDVKAARLDLYLRSAPPASWARDGEPNLLLMAHLRPQLDAALTKLRPELNQDLVRAIEESRDELFALVDQLLANVSPQSQRHMAKLVRARAAPSPFCTIGATRPQA